MPKKNNGDGCIFQVSDTKWVAQIQIGKKENGKPNIKKFSAKTQAEVKRKLKEFKKSFGIISTSEIKKYTVSQYFDYWLSLKKNELKPLSYQRLTSTVETFVKSEIGYLQFASVDTKDIQNIIVKYQYEKSYSTIKKIYDAINAIYKYDAGLSPNKRISSYNPCSNVIINRKSTKTLKKVKIFSDDELNLIKNEINRKHSNGKPVYPYGSIYILMLNTGVRMGEALALNKSDINIEKRTLSINKNLVLVKNQDCSGYSSIIQDHTKTLSGNRKISLNDGAINAINKLYNLFPLTDKLIINRNNQRVSTQNAEKTFNNILKHAGIDEKGRNCHALRHTFATKLFEKGKDIKDISSILGHSSVRITQDIYIEVIQKRQAEMINTIPNF